MKERRSKSNQSHEQKYYRVSPSARWSLNNEGTFLTQISHSNGAFSTASEILLLLQLIAQKTPTSKLAPRLKSVLQELLKTSPTPTEIDALIHDLLGAGVLYSVNPSTQERSHLTDDGFADSWIQWAMLADETRTRCYFNAIEDLLKPGQSAVDLGCGTGILGMYCLEKKAKFVHFIEETAISRTLENTLKSNNHYKDRYRIHEVNSHLFELSEPADVVVSELFGNDPFSEGLIQTLQDFWNRNSVFLKHAAFCPSHLRVYAQLIDLNEGCPLFERVSQLQKTFDHAEKEKDFYFDSLHKIRKNLDFSSLSLSFPIRKQQFTALSSSFIIGESSLHPAKISTKNFKNTQKIVSQKAGSCPCLMLWFEVDVSAHQKICSHPLLPHFASHWSPLIIPLLRPFSLSEDLVLSTSLQSDSTHLAATLAAQRGATTEILGAR